MGLLISIWRACCWKSRLNQLGGNTLSSPGRLICPWVFPLRPRLRLASPVRAPPSAERVLLSPLVAMSWGLAACRWFLNSVQYVRNGRDMHNFIVESDQQMENKAVVRLATSQQSQNPDVKRVFVTLKLPDWADLTFVARLKRQLLSLACVSGI